MSLFNWIGQRFGTMGESARKAWGYFAGGSRDSSGEVVNAERAMGITAFWRGIRLIGETVGTLPPAIYRLPVLGGDGVIERGSPYDVLARVTPNQDQTTVEFWEGMVASMMVVGDGMARKQMIGEKTVAFEPLIPDPACTYPFRNSQGALRYRGRNWQGRIYPDLAPEEVFHLKGFGFGGDSGLSAIRYGTAALGLSLASTRVASQTFASGLATSGFLETQATFNEPDRKTLEDILARYQQNNEPGKMMVLEGGMKFNKLSMTAVDAELLATMGFNIEEIARLLGIPPILLGHSTDGQTMWGTGVESICQAWYTLGLRAIITRVEKAFQKRVITPKDQPFYYLKFNVNGLLRGDSETQARIAAQLTQNGLSNRDEQRALLGDLPPIPGGGGKIFTAQVNLVPLEKLGQEPASGAPNGPPTQPVRNLIAQMIADEIERAMDEQRWRARKAG